MSYVNSRWPNRPPVLKPDVVIDYIKHMGGVDRSDHFVSSYQFMRRTKKWYRKMFFWFLEVAIINSYLLYKDVQSAAGNRKAMSHFMFRKSLVRSLVQERSTTRPKASRKRGRPVQGPPDERLDGRQHFIARREKGTGRCVVCTQNGLRKETIYVCETCTARPNLHPDACFKTYHTIP
ncbi:piggyBac transposable element-derived protein 4-like [Macrosteles quadrilineatus]|uniref:piggyBac transposable element-derived protein 4-like n=1 Tax=Macrosteles quadrilineatus TaxID=74068 RepID=UPI0023E21880|nr:piggyBac transposable element-derived protein 4-like [Macrosteles quadrilineatus]